MTQWQIGVPKKGNRCSRNNPHFWVEIFQLFSTYSPNYHKLALWLFVTYPHSSEVKRRGQPQGLTKGSLGEASYSGEYLFSLTTDHPLTAMSYSIPPNLLHWSTDAISILTSTGTGPTGYQMDLMPYGPNIISKYTFDLAFSLSLTNRQQTTFI